LIDNQAVKLSPESCSTQLLQRVSCFTLLTLYIVKPANNVLLLYSAGARFRFFNKVPISFHKLVFR